MSRLSAFPFEFSDEFDIIMDSKPWSMGMSLLDYFAARALQSVQYNPRLPDHSDATLAEYCYDIAEAMLAEKEKRK